jgi:hypothetical protein
LLRTCAVGLSVVTLACATHAAGGASPAAEPTPSSQPTDASEPLTHADARPTTDHPVDDFGYSIVGDDIYPPLYERVEPVSCTSPDLVPGECVTDADCGTGFACLCGSLQGFGGIVGGTCVPAECLTGADCESGHCLVSLGNRPDHCCSFGRMGLFCRRSASTCQHGGDCLGSGRACIYDEGLDHFECKAFGCSCEG